ncbi:MULTISPECIES: nitrilase-related carbon-nitrogen hydrolase [unclassified Lentimonas]|uniref:nitrilase-related carbon-nitrogen hydrolase n=1 Tax=unclassified Lentimonas TaxID=2630993 RepID=UPI0013237494|nr:MULTISPECIES: nitrilase-related carbon-nitrogen hydrolase [unclassified Lentimonas]CAA6677946.1 FIG003879: Predicted amidohydrolase [Lentimonas sp. CC4]CAA6684050.1 FIG003879: Predicted amidohydrolase [Lentimonas sp. CC6]CAA7076574.1 FIG003879: Predicted amidohydrolase [Lentimonas sp. CC4]CAA7170097.1 FIG003879: Predicted amidohydrolase [Lentimonas sp. CC21]CAA7181382.1 FIG003879: Predicted amidohydrolase [Lentimonas sp. CC8]
MKIALAQFEVHRGNPAANLEAIAAWVAEAKAGGAGAVFLPEMCTTGFDWKRCRELLPEAAEHRVRLAALAKVNDIAICGSFLEQTESGCPANALTYFERSGAVAAHYRKVHLFTLFGEQKHVEAGERIVTAETELGRVGCSVCYDLRFPELFRKCALDGAVIQVLPAAFPHPRLAHWRTLIQARAIENQSYFIATNQCGVEGHGSSVGETRYFGHSMVVDPWGEILLEADECEGVHFVDIDIEKVAKTRSALTALKDRRPELYGTD